MPGELRGPLTLASSCRWNSTSNLGARGTEYEFDIKMPKLRVRMSHDEFEAEADAALDVLADELRRRYSWIGRIGRAGRSGGWLSVEDKKGLATQAKLKTIIGLVASAKERFAAYLEKYYPEDGAKRVRRRR